MQKNPADAHWEDETREHFLRWDCQEEESERRVGIQRRTRRTGKVSTFAPNVATCSQVAPYQVCSQTGRNTVAELLTVLKLSLLASHPNNRTSMCSNGTRPWATSGNALSWACHRALPECFTAPSKGTSGWQQCLPVDSDVWVQAIYSELLHASSRSRAQRGKEEKRPPHRSKYFVFPIKGKFKSDMTEGLRLLWAPKHCLVSAPGSILCMCGFRQHGCLWLSMLSKCGGIGWVVDRALSPSWTLKKHRSLRQGSLSTSTRSGRGGS